MSGFPASVFTAFPVRSGFSDYYGSSVAMPDFQCLPHSPFRRSGLGNLQLTEVVGKCELSVMCFRSVNAGSPARRASYLITYQRATLSDTVRTAGFRQISCARTEQGLGTRKIQTQNHPHIHLSLQFSRTRLPLGDLPLS